MHAADPQRPGSSADHIVWGGLEASLDTSNDSVNSNNSHSHASTEKDRKKRIANRRLHKDEVLFLSGSTSDASSSKANEDSLKFRDDDAADDADQLQTSADGKKKKKRINNKKLTRDEAQSMSASDSDSSGAKSRDPPCSSSVSRTLRMSWADTADDNDDAEDEAEPEDEQLGPLPSQGSSLHESGHCKPCLFLYETIGCKNGSSCSFCHYNHNRRSVARQSKGKRDRFRKLVSRMEALEQEPEQEQQPVAVGRVVRGVDGSPLPAAPGPVPVRKHLMSL